MEDDAINVLCKGRGERRWRSGLWKEERRTFFILGGSHFLRGRWGPSAAAHSCGCPSMEVPKAVDGSWAAWAGGWGEAGGCEGPANQPCCYSVMIINPQGCGSYRDWSLDKIKVWLPCMWMLVCCVFSGPYPCNMDWKRRRKKIGELKNKEGSSKQRKNHTDDECLKKEELGTCACGQLQREQPLIPKQNAGKTHQCVTGMGCGWRWQTKWGSGDECRSLSLQKVAEYLL